MKLYELKQMIKEEINRVINESLQDKMHQMMQDDPEKHKELLKLKHAIEVDLFGKDAEDFERDAERYENQVKGGKYLRVHVNNKYFLIDWDNNEFRVRELIDMGDVDKDFKFNEPAKRIYDYKKDGYTTEDPNAKPPKKLILALNLAYQNSFNKKPES